MTYREIFKGKCPYTNKKCDDWNCKECKVNKEEEKSLKKYLEELTGGEQMKYEYLIVYCYRKKMGWNIGNAYYKSVSKIDEKAIRQEEKFLKKLFKVKGDVVVVNVVLLRKVSG